MPSLALNIHMAGKLVVIIGGGAVALRKLRTLLKSGASVRVVAMDICPEIVALSNETAFEIRHGCYLESDLNDAFMVIAATNDPLVNDQVRADSHERKILVMAADKPATGDCTLPVSLQRGDLKISVSTEGRCPTFARDVSDYIAGMVGAEFGMILEQLAAEREKLLTNGTPSTYNVQVLRSLARRLIAETSGRKEPLP